MLTSAGVLGAYVGESERRLREVFEAAQRDVDAGHIAVVFMDEVRRRIMDTCHYMSSHDATIKLPGWLCPPRWHAVVSAR